MKKGQGQKKHNSRSEQPCSMSNRHINVKDTKILTKMKHDFMMSLQVY